ncbi:hypothetical protein AYI68_g4298 [Smittium mucronatum]|uniref:Uncharacterized protein n=1 Tax=Smittium mucronatum TaxID=133383 RepID=A0A1R0GXH4_9FUNG|nr:hypothetical protein AYI68_g4298 [Smittium mucronatum]
MLQSICLFYNISSKLQNQQLLLLARWLAALTKTRGLDPHKSKLREEPTSLPSSSPSHPRIPILSGLLPQIASRFLRSHLVATRFSSPIEITFFLKNPSK